MNNDLVAPAVAAAFATVAGLAGCKRQRRPRFKAILKLTPFRRRAYAAPLLHLRTASLGSLLSFPSSRYLSIINIVRSASMHRQKADTESSKTHSNAASKWRWKGEFPIFDIRTIIV